MGSGIPREVTAVELEGLEPQPPPQLCGEQTPGLPRLTLLSSPVHGLRGSPPVHEGFGFQHQDAGHQVSSASPHGLLLLGQGGSEPHTSHWWHVGLLVGARLPAAPSNINTSMLSPLEESRPALPEGFPFVTLSFLAVLVPVSLAPWLEGHGGIGRAGAGVD